MEQMVMDFHAKQGQEQSTLTPVRGAGTKGNLWAAHLACETHSRFLYDRTNLNLYRAHLMLQELSEVLEALHFGRTVELADGLADLVYVAIGTAVQFGIPFDPVFLEVHRSNMSKDNVLETNRGKGRTYSPPDIEGVLDGIR